MSMGHSLEEALQMHESHKDQLVKIGDETHTFQHWCRIYGISCDTVRSRVSRGWDLHVAITTPSNKVFAHNTKYYEINGVKKSIDELSVEYKINQSTLKGRLEHGSTIEEALNLVPVERMFSESENCKASRIKLYTRDGKTKTLLGWCEHLNLNFATVQHRMLNGISFEEAIDKLRFPGAQTYVVNGKEMTRSQICKEYNIDKQYLNVMLTRQNMSIEEAIERRVPTRPKLCFIVDGKEMSLAQISKMCNIKHRTLYSRLRSGLTIEEAIKFDKKQKKETPPPFARVFLIDGKEMTVSEISERCNISISTINCKLRRGLTIEQAIRPVARTFLVDGEELTVSEISKKCNITASTINRRLKRGLSIYEAINLG